MSTELAQILARSAYEEAIEGVFGFVESRVEWRRDNAHRLMLEAFFMVEDLKTRPGLVAFRRARIRTWENRYRRHRARALADDRISAEACQLAAEGRL